MSRVRTWLQKRWWKFPIGVWLIGIFSLLIGIVIFCFFFIRREVVQFLPEHTFSVSDPAFFASAHALGVPVPIKGNKIELLNNGDQIFPALLGAIKSAKKSVNFETFLFHSGQVGSQFRDAFCERAKAGVIVRILLDGVGSGTKLDDEDVETMKRAGCQFAYYHPTRSWRIDRTNRRSHRRILVVDGKLGFAGGVGFADEWQGNGDAENHWRDVHARIEGPLVGELQGAFQQHWMKETGQGLSGADEFPELAPVGDLTAQVTASHSFAIAPLPLVQAISIAAAEKSVFITNAYCTPNKDQVELLKRAVQRGVDVRLLVPGKHNDQPMTKAAGRNAYGQLLECGVKIYEYEPAMIHTKTMVVDSLFSMFGSSNLDSRSAALNEELDVTVYNAAFGKQMTAAFEEDLKHSKPYTLVEFKKRSAWERLAEWAIAPFHSQL
ncbi:MAG: Phospholipase D/Transphosphatidylase [Chthoniobacteraceae bacterium]|nr:Phospholipase D/Transphosphatidylase [Chthoniobacteraceae bacterium]